MSLRDLHSNMKVHVLLPPIVVNNDTEGKPADGAGLNVLGFDSAELVAVCGISADTLSGAVKYDVILQHADTDVDGSYAAVTSANDVIVGSNPRVTAPNGSGIIATVDDPAEDPFHFRIGYRGPKPFCRLILDTTGTHTNGFPATIIGLLGHPSRAPTLDA